jgi:TPR repeat protein
LRGQEAIATCENDDARRLLERAAADGDSVAMCSLGSLLEDSAQAQARGWYEKAIGLGNVDAMVTSPYGGVGHRV